MAADPHVPDTTARAAVLTRRVRWLVTATIAYNVVEAVVAITAGSRAGSTALIGFGLDSVVEVSSAAAVAWQFSARAPEVRQAREQRALRLVAISFFVLAAYVAVESVRELFGADRARPSTVGLVLAAISLAVMPVLSLAQRRAGREIGSVSAVADSKQTLLCTYLSAVLLVGLGVNLAFGWWWADSIAALVIAVVAVREGREAWRGDGCCAAPKILAGVPLADATAADDCGDETCTAACCAAVGAAVEAPARRRRDLKGERAGR